MSNSTIGSSSNCQSINGVLAGAGPLMTLDCIDDLISASNKSYAEERLESESPLVPLTRERVLAKLMLNDHARFRDHDAEEVVRSILGTIISRIAEATPVDPWPELTRAGLTSMMGKRNGPCGYNVLGDIAAGCSHMGDGGSGLSLKEKFYCAQFREWLAKGLPNVRSGNDVDAASSVDNVRPVHKNHDKLAA